MTGRTSNGRAANGAIAKGLVHHGERVDLYAGDALDVLKGMAQRSVDTCLTSPPYWGLRDYGESEELGGEQTVDDYVERLVGIMGQVRRVLKDKGTAWLNIGDTYLGSRRGGISKTQRTKGMEIKQLCLVPFRVAIALQDEGWILRNCVTWYKPNATPSSAKDRLTNHWEPVFLLAKSPDYYFDLDSIRVTPKTSDADEARRAKNGMNGRGKAVGKKDLRSWLSSPRHRVHIEGHKEVIRRPDSPEPIELAAFMREAMRRKGWSIHDVANRMGIPFERARHYLRLDVVGSRLPPPDTWLKLKRVLDLGPEFDERMKIVVGTNTFRNHPLGRNPGDVLRIPVQPYPGQHFAVMPLGLATSLLKATLPSDGVCLDPFAGAGTSGVAALQLGGRFVGIDVKKSYLRDALRRMEKHGSDASDSMVWGKEIQTAWDDLPNPANLLRVSRLPRNGVSGVAKMPSSPGVPSIPLP